MSRILAIGLAAAALLGGAPYEDALEALRLRSEALNQLYSGPVCR